MKALILFTILVISGFAEARSGSSCTYWVEPIDKDFAEFATRIETPRYGSHTTFTVSKYRKVGRSELTLSYVHQDEEWDVYRKMDKNVDLIIVEFIKPNWDGTESKASITFDRAKAMSKESALDSTLLIDGKKFKASLSMTHWCMKDFLNP